MRKQGPKLVQQAWQSSQTLNIAMATKPWAALGLNFPGWCLALLLAISVSPFNIFKPLPFNPFRHCHLYSVFPVLLLV